MTITEILKTGPASPSDLMEQTGMSRSAFYRNLNTLLQQGTIKKHSNGNLAIAKIPPSPWEIMEKMEIIFQQKGMDKNYRRKSNDDKADDVLVHYMDYILKGLISDYNEEVLQKVIFDGYTLFIQRNALYSK